jgi:Tol biopolymer transport system component
MPNPPLDASGAYRYPSWSPDSQKIAFVHSDVDFASQDSSRYLYVLDATSPQEQKLADLRPLADVSIFESVSYGLSWSPDGQEITFIANYPGSHTLYRLNVESGVTSVITQQYNPSSTVWTPDGQWILFNSSERSPQENIYRIRPDGSDLQPLLQSEGWFISGKIYLSPDGQRIAFWGFDSGGENLPVEWQFHLYSMRVDGSDLHELAAVGNLFFGPVWSPDSSQIAFTDDCEGEPNNEFYRCLYRVNAAGGELELLKEGGIYHNDTLGWALAPGF